MIHPCLSPGLVVVGRHRRCVADVRRVCRREHGATSVIRRGLRRRFFSYAWSTVDLTNLSDPPLEVHNSLGRGFRVLIDRENVLTSIDRAALAPTAPDPPSEAEYQQLVTDYLYHVLWTARHIKRCELWWGRSGLEGRLMQLMLPMLEWHSRFGVERGTDTWLRGRFLERWADADAVAALAGATSRYDATDVIAALPRNHELFRRMARLVGDKLGYQYPVHADAEIARLSKDVLAF